MVVLYTGNTLRHQLQPNADVSYKIRHVLEDWKQHTGKNLEYTNGYILPPVDFFADCACNHDQSAELTLKLFLPTGTTVDQAQHRINTALTTFKELKKGSIHQLILSIQGLSFEHDTENESIVSDNALYSIWKAATTINQQVDHWGISELSTNRLQALLKKIDTDNGIAPTIDHINASDCCALPPKLITLSRERNIKLMAHHDPQDLVPKSELETLGIKGDWDWIMRLTYIVKDRQVLSGNEYLISIELDS